MKWAVIFHDDFDPEFEGLPEAVQDSLLAHAALLQTLGPNLGRPRVDTEGVHGSTTTPETESHCVAGRSRAFSVLIRAVSSAIYSLV